MSSRKELWFGFDDNIDIGVLDKVFNLEYSVLFVDVKQLPFLDSVKPAGGDLAGRVSRDR